MSSTVGVSRQRRIMVGFTALIAVLMSTLFGTATASAQTVEVKQAAVAQQQAAAVQQAAAASTFNSFQLFMGVRSGASRTYSFTNYGRCDHEGYLATYFPSSWSKAKSIYFNGANGCSCAAVSYYWQTYYYYVPGWIYTNGNTLRAIRVYRC